MTHERHQSGKVVFDQVLRRFIIKASTTLRAWRIRQFQKQRARRAAQVFFSKN